jgi:hypothetical protein
VSERERGAPEPEGTELLLLELREEGHRLVTHPIKEVERLEKVAAQGESAATPLIVVAGITVVVTVLFVIFAALAIGAYYLV